MRRRLLLLPLLAALGGAAPLASISPPPGGTLAERYEQARRVLEQQRTSETQTLAARERLATEARDLRERLVANALEVQQLEAALEASSADVERLRVQERALEEDLADDRARVVRLLTVLQRLDADRPPALAMRPDDSLAAARGSMILGAMLPPVYEQAAILSGRLRSLSTTRVRLETQSRAAQNQARALAKAREELAKLLDLRGREMVNAEAKLKDIRAVTEEVAREAGDLKSLIDRIASLRAKGDPNHGMVVVTPRRAAAAALRRGSLIQPVSGNAIVGDPAGPGTTPGNTPQGLWFVGPGSAQAVAPGDAEVVFAGPYQKFGQVLLLEIAGGYHLLLAGLDRIDVRIGDLVLAGEPVGVLPQGKTARLYLELRRNGERVDPGPWMSTGLRKARG
jgi:septal ring factor EnvC (AmiA/AmiB activator)